MDYFRKSKKVYNSIKIPDELKKIVDGSLKSDTDTSERKKHLKQELKNQKRFNILKPVMTVACSVCLAFFIILNISPAFAKAASSIPIIGAIAEVFTISSYFEETDNELITAKVPALKNTGNTELEKRINGEIMNKVNALLHDAKNRAKDYRDMVIEANDPEIVFHKSEIEINYDVKSRNENRVSFVLRKSESLVNFQEERFYYNIDLTTGNDITLKDMLGEDYKKIANEQIKKQIKQIKKENKNALFFDEKDSPFLEHGAAFAEISDEQDFYINEKGNVVIVFPKYSIAPGYMGVLEFEIIN